MAFHPPQNSKGTDGAAGGKDEEWILAVVIGCINQDKNRSVYDCSDSTAKLTHALLDTKSRTPNPKRTASQDSE